MLVSSFFTPDRAASKLHLPDELYSRLTQLLKDIKAEIDVYKPNDDHLQLWVGELYGWIVSKRVVYSHQSYLINANI